MSQERITFIIDDKIKQEIKLKALQEKKTVTEVVITLLKKWLKSKG